MLQHVHNIDVLVGEFKLFDQKNGEETEAVTMVFATTSVVGLTANKSNNDTVII
ncbi:hypothetical protein LL266_12420 [Vibrio anguillarum]|nr:MULTISPECIES: hypothetical protein [Vibrio]AGU59879.1 hypothetical protein N175_17845 [Vibrio anguillarum M3]MBT2929137.1 hypothetical protein [Vibrio anguillarum]MBT2946548.1 hypothetical protein [Vibrio anguillarum]MBT2957411.1 hypothetical protein [Vibrio anguillarum]MBY7672568.1 hypothetical protein [Vibrio anguillarum]